MMGVKTNLTSTLPQDQSRALIPDTPGLRGNPKCCVKPQDPGIRMWADTALFMLGGFLLKHMFPFSVFFSRYFLAKNVHLKKSYFLSFFSRVSLKFLQFLSSIFFFLSSVSPEQDEKDLTGMPK